MNPILKAVTWGIGVCLATYYATTITLNWILLIAIMMLWLVGGYDLISLTPILLALYAVINFVGIAAVTVTVTKFYQRFKINQTASPRLFLWTSIITTIFLTFVSLIATYLVSFIVGS